MSWVMGGYSIVNFVFVYFTVRMLKKVVKNEQVWSSVRFPLTGVAIFVGMFALFAGIDLIARWTGHGHLVGIGSVFASYDAPHVWIMAIAVLLFFVWQVKVPDWLGKVAMFCAPSMFGIYLLHTTTSFGAQIYQIPERWMAANTALHPALIVVIAAVWTFVFCLGVDLVRRGAVKLLVGRRGLSPPNQVGRTGGPGRHVGQRTADGGQRQGP